MNECERYDLAPILTELDRRRADALDRERRRRAGSIGADSHDREDSANQKATKGKRKWTHLYTIVPLPGSGYPHTQSSSGDSLAGQDKLVQIHFGGGRRLCGEGDCERDVDVLTNGLRARLAANA